jgi:hypothetical protein
LLDISLMYSFVLHALCEFDRHCFDKKGKRDSGTSYVNKK